MPLAKGGLAHYAIDAKTSLFTVQAFAAGLASVVAHSPSFAIRDMIGEFEFVLGTMNEASLQLTINLRSLEILDEVTSFDRREIERVMFDEVLETSRYPKAEYESTHVDISDLNGGICRVDITGDLTLHGVTRGVNLETHVVVAEDSVRGQGSFSITQPDFGLKIASVAGGTLKLREELKCHYFIIAPRQD
jgi:polyisoprenoid-binding protein YceI